MGLVGRVGLVIPFWMLDTRRCSSSRCRSIVCVYKSGERVLVYFTKIRSIARRAANSVIEVAFDPIE